MILTIAKSTFYFTLTLVLIFLSYGSFRVYNDFKYEYETSKSNIAEIRENSSVELKKNTENILKYIDKRTVGLENKTFTLVADSMNEAVILRQDISTTLKTTNDLIKTYKNIPNRLEAKFSNSFDCDLNAYCLQNLTTDTLLDVKDSAKNSSQASKEIVVFTQNFSKDLTEISKDVKIVTTSFSDGEKITTNIEKLTNRPWWERIFGYAANGSLIWFNVNRARIQ